MVLFDILYCGLDRKILWLLLTTCRNIRRMASAEESDHAEQNESRRPRKADDSRSPSVPGLRRATGRDPIQASVLPMPPDLRKLLRGRAGWRLKSGRFGPGENDDQVNAANTSWLGETSRRHFPDTIAAMAGAIAGAHLGIGGILRGLLESGEDGEKGRTYMASLATELCAAAGQG